MHVGNDDFLNEWMNEWMEEHVCNVQELIYPLFMSYWPLFVAMEM